MLTAAYILVVFLLVLANGFFVASEFALVGVRRSRIELMAEGGNGRARLLLALLDNLNAYISATQLGITMASLALGWIGEPVFAHMLEEPLRGRVSETALHTISFLIAFVIITFLHIVLGELAPKTLALERAERVALAVAWPLHAFYKIFSWPIRALDWAGTRTVRLFGLRPSSDHAAVYTGEELRRLVEASRKSGHIEADEQKLIDSVFEFSDAEVREAMVPRTQVEALPATATLEEARSAFRASGYSRLPVYRDGLDHIVGVMFRKDLDMGQARAETFSPERLARPPVFVTATATLGAALAQMKAKRTHLAFVVDEHGGVEGIVTLEDLLEEIVGEIDDEFDDETRSQILEQADGTYLLDGMLAVRDANRRFKLSIHEDGRYTTLAGFLMERAGRLLRPGDEVAHEGALFRVERVEGRRIRRVRFAPAPREREVGDKQAGGDGFSSSQASALLPLFGGASAALGEGGAELCVLSAMLL